VPAGGVVPRPGGDSVASPSRVDAGALQRQETVMHNENMAIVKSLVSVAWADGVYGDEEREMVEALIAAFEASDEQAEEIRSYAAEKKTLEDIPFEDLSPDDGRVLLQHAVLLSYIDGEQHESEKRHILDLCGKLQIPDAEAQPILAQAETRAKRFLNLL
jgi:tellurite resistance protein